MRIEQLGAAPGNRETITLKGLTGTMAVTAQY
jgi:hypothetical protein